MVATLADADEGENQEVGPTEVIAIKRLMMSATERLWLVRVSRHNV
jgi:hypothetical protein